MSYTSTFFENQAAGSRSSANRIAAIVADLVHPESVIDVGCGVGTWLAAFQAVGAKVIDGYDGAYVDREQLQIPIERFHPVDLVASLDDPAQWPDRMYDLAVSLEVGEHLPASVSGALVDRLVSLAPTILFSAAIPRQSGTGHVNERWQSEWASLFAERGFHPHDAIRSKVWTDSSVEPWYAQNMLLYTREPAPAGIVLDVVHPKLWEKNLHNAALSLRLWHWMNRLFWRTVRSVRR